MSKREKDAILQILVFLLWQELVVVQYQGAERLIVTGLTLMIHHIRGR